MIFNNNLSKYLHCSWRCVDLLIEVTFSSFQSWTPQMIKAIRTFSISTKDNHFFRLTIWDWKHHLTLSSIYAAIVENLILHGHCTKYIYPTLMVISYLWGVLFVAKVFFPNLPTIIIRVLTRKGNLNVTCAALNLWWSITSKHI